MAKCRRERKKEREREERIIGRNTFSDIIFLLKQ